MLEAGKLLRFPIRDKSACTARVQILQEDKRFFEGNTLNDVLKYSSKYNTKWHTRCVREVGDVNYAVPEECTVRVRKLRKD